MSELFIFNPLYSFKKHISNIFDNWVNNSCVELRYKFDLVLADNTLTCLARPMY